MLDVLLGLNGFFNLQPRLLVGGSDCLVVLVLLSQFFDDTRLKRNDLVRQGLFVLLPGGLHELYLRGKIFQLIWKQVDGLELRLNLIHDYFR